ncbi:hypothetical protein SC404_14265 [Legionella pneumophila serogroup 1]|nr:hypothetical protein [Legionella pneumophila]HAT8124189.1 hypothetical protein [Legionella pneumophila]
MTSTEVVAYLGALAWAPQLMQWGYNFYTKPCIRVIPDRAAQVGYTIFGPIFNLRLSIDVSKKDTIIDFIGVQLKHESGASYDFEWMGMNEVFSEVITTGVNSNGGNQIVQKDVSPIAIKVSSISLVEKFFRFQEKKYIYENRIKSNALIQSHNMAIKMKKEGKNVDFIWRELEDYMSFLREKFIWQPGKYTMSFELRSPIKFNYTQGKYEFELTQADVETLNLNFSEMESIKYNMENEIENKQETMKEINWVW